MYNRRYLETHFEKLSRDLRGGSKPISILIMDVDHFKKVNDDYGHAAGDLVLQGLAQRVLGGIRGFDTAIRLGGEEFVVLMPNVEGRSAFVAANRLREMVEVHPFPISDDGQTLKVTMSIGVATGVAGEIPLNGLLERADQALYAAKHGGRNRVEVAEDDKVAQDDKVAEDPLPEAARA